MRYWKRVDALGKTTTVEAYSFDKQIEGAIEITKEEYEAFIRSLPSNIDWKAEWSKASTVQDKLKVLAQYLGLEQVTSTQ
jgi:hypothetical protein